MAAAQASQPTFIPPSVPIPVQIPADSSIWDRISSWVSENKAVVYTIAGVTVAVAAGGVVYYSSTSVRTTNLRPPFPNNALVRTKQRTVLLRSLDAWQSGYLHSRKANHTTPP